MITVPNVTPPVKEVGSAPGRHLYPTIQKSESGILATAKNRGGNREMLTVAMKIQASHETHNVKVCGLIIHHIYFKLVCCVLFCHRVNLMYDSWFPFYFFKTDPYRVSRI